MIREDDSAVDSPAQRRNDVTDDNVDLRRYLRDLVALSTLPAMWVGEPPEGIAGSVAEALVVTLQADFVHVRLESGSAADVVETCMEIGSPRRSDAREIGRSLAPWLRPQERVRVPSIPNPLGKGTVCLAVVPIGRAGSTLGVIAAGVERPDFPSRYDLLLMNVVANHVAIALQSAQLRVVQDQLAERRRAEEILRRSEERFRALIEHSSDIITLHRRDRTMTYVSPSTSRILGYQPGDLLGELESDTVHLDDRLRLGRIWSDLVERPASVTTFRYRLRHNNGSWRWMEATGTNLLDEPAVGAVVINRRDVTHEIEAQQLLEQRVAERTRQLESLYRADETLHRSLRLEDVLQALVDVSSDVLGVDKAAVLVRDADNRRLVIHAARGFGQGVVESLTLATDEGIAGLVLRSGEAIGVPEYAADPGTSVRLREFLEANDVRAQMSVPIVADGEIFAVFNVYYAARHEFGEDERRLFVALAQRAGLAIENARLYEAARGKAALEERQKLARELHDSVSQALYAIALNASSVAELLPSEAGKARDLVGDVLRLADAGLAEMRALIFELRPESLETEGLAGAIEKQVAAVQARHNLLVKTRLCLEPDVSLAIKEAMYRIAQEALHNIVKHARASTIELVLEERAAQLELCITDDGKGFDPSATFAGHLGLHSMRERAAALGGTLDIQSTSGQGTRVSVQMPVSPSG
jgi:PAS domain S-box-containing protein